MTLTAFLLARMDDAEASAGLWLSADANEQGETVVTVGKRRLLVEAEVKRRIVQLHSVYNYERDGMGYRGCGCRECGWSAEYADTGGECLTLRLLALPYADHPDYRDEWRP